MLSYSALCPSKPILDNAHVTKDSILRISLTLILDRQRHIFTRKKNNFIFILSLQSADIYIGS